MRHPYAVYEWFSPVVEFREVRAEPSEKFRFQEPPKDEFLRKTYQVTLNLLSDHNSGLHASFFSIISDL